MVKDSRFCGNSKQMAGRLKRYGEGQSEKVGG
jgi:hypothetical protein